MEGRAPSFTVIACVPFHCRQVYLSSTLDSTRGRHDITTHIRGHVHMTSAKCLDWSPPHLSLSHSHKISVILSAFRYPLPFPVQTSYEHAPIGMIMKYEGTFWEMSLFFRGRLPFLCRASSLLGPCGASTYDVRDGIRRGEGTSKSRWCKRCCMHFLHVRGWKQMGILQEIQKFSDVISVHSLFSCATHQLLM